LLRRVRLSRHSPDRCITTITITGVTWESSMVYRRMRPTSRWSWLRHSKHRTISVSPACM